MIQSWRTAKNNYRRFSRRVKDFGLMEATLTYSIPLWWYWLRYEYLPMIKSQIIKLFEKKDNRFALGTKLNAVGGLSIWMVNNPAFKFKDGKKYGMTSFRDATEFAKRNNLVMGGDELEQEALKNKAQKEKDYENRIADNVVKDLLQRRIIRG